MKEIEMKILGIGKRAIFAKLRRLGAKKIFSALLRVKYFDYPDNRIRRKRDLLRVREFIFSKRDKRKVEVVYKTFRGVKQGCKIFDEAEFYADRSGAFENICNFLKRLGLKQTAHFEKKRTGFVYRQWKFEFDEYPKIPPFLEIEAHSEKDVKKAIKALGLEDYEKSSETIQALIQRKYPELRLNGLVF